MSPAKNKPLHFTCPQCMALLKASSTLAGTRCRCPRCQYVFVAPQHSRLPPSGETYALHQGTEPSPAKTSTSIPVTCSVCQTRMFGDLDQVGQTLICPDCGTPAVVPPPEIVKKPAARPLVNDIYPLCEEVQSGSDNPPIEEPSLIRVMCPRCDTMMYATEDQIGHSLTCPDCTTSVVVPRPQPRRPVINVMAGAGEGYALADQQQASADPPPPPPAAAQSRRHFEPYFRKPILPRQPFLTGTFSFPFTRGVLPRYLMLITFTTIVIGYLRGSALLSETDPGVTWFGSAMLLASGTVLAVAWFGVASVHALAIVRDTANGCDDIQNWPGMAFIEWLTEPLYVLFSVCASLLPGIALEWLLTKYGQPGEVAIPISLFLLFPFVMLSTLETESPLGVISWPVCQTLWWASRGWLSFYLATTGLLAATTAAIAAAFSAGTFWGMIVASATLSAVWFIYFRLLGRLALYCADRARKRAKHDPTE